MNISENIHAILKQIPSDVKLIAVSKTKPVKAINAAYNSGQRIFGENRVQELSDKYKQLPTDIHWHFIGHLQSNKIKFIAPFVNLIHSVDSFKLLMEINKEAKKNNRVINCLLQIYIAKEETKFGFDMDEIEEMLSSKEVHALHNIKIVGVMGMATYTKDTSVIRKEFKSLKNYFDEIKSKYFENDSDFKEISMGMTNDYMIAIEEGSTMVRIGSAIFGERKIKDN